MRGTISSELTGGGLIETMQRPYETGGIAYWPAINPDGHARRGARIRAGGVLRDRALARENRCTALSERRSCGRSRRRSRRFPANRPARAGVWIALRLLHS